MKKVPRVFIFLLILSFCVSLFPGAALAEEPGEIAPVEEGEMAQAGDKDYREMDDPAEEPDRDGRTGEEIQGTVLYSGYCGEYTTWTLDDQGVLVISGTGAISFPPSLNPWSQYRNTINTVRISKGVTSICDRAFQRFPYLRSVTIASTVTSIGSGAFSQCTSLTEVQLAEGLVELSGFASCSALTEIRIPSTVKTIGVNAFQYCSALTEITIPEGVTEIWDNAFAGCSLNRVTIPPSVTYIGENAFACGGEEMEVEVYFSDLRAWMSIRTENKWSLPWGPRYLNGALVRELELPEGITRIPDGAFSGCKSLERVTIPKSVTAIGEYAFYGCDLIRELELPARLDSIGNDAFQNCTSLSALELPAQLDSIGNYAFQNCTSLSALELPTSLTWIGGYAFADCTALKNITIPPRVTVLSDCLFQGCSGISKLEIPETVTEIQEYAFAGTSLESVFIPASVEKTWGSAYYLCPKLAEITVDERNPNYSSLDGILYEKGMTKLLCCPQQKEGDILIPESITMVDGHAFYECSNITSVSFPWKNSEWHLAGEAFYQCENLREITFRGRSPYLLSGSAGYGSAFIGITATAYFPKNNYTWGESGNANLAAGSSITWVGYEETPVVYDAGVCGKDLTWELYSDGCLKIRGTGEMYDYESGGPWWDNKYYIKKIVLDKGVTGIGDHAFFFCNNLESVELPEGLKRIGQESFSTCGISLRSIWLPVSLVLVEKEAFSECTELKEVRYGGTVAQWEKLDIRLDNTELKSANIFCTNGVLDHSQSCGDHLRWSLNEASGILTISGTGDMWNFKYQRSPWLDKTGSIRSVVLKPGVESIGAYAFSGNGNLKEVPLPDSLRAIGAHAFESCGGIQKINIPEGVIRIGEGAFSWCSNLAGVTLPNTLLEIQNDTFSYCAALTSVRFPNSLLKIGAKAFYNCAELTGVLFPETLAEIGASAFEYCSGLKSICFPYSLIWIGENAFNCAYLKDVRFEGSAPAIGGSHSSNMGSILPSTTAYYPAGDESWTEKVRESFGSGITWVSYVPTLLGDANGDGKLNIMDLIRLRKYLAGAPVELNAASCDLNGDGTVGSADLIRLRKKLTRAALTG